MDSELAYTAKEAAGKARVTVDFFYRLLHGKVRGQKGPPFKRIGDRIVIPVKSFTIWLETPSKPRKG